MNDRLCFEVHDNQGYFVFPDTWFGPLLGEFEEVLDAYDADEISRRVTSTNSDALLNGSRTLLIYTLIWHMHFWNRMPRVRH